MFLDKDEHSQVKPSTPMCAGHVLPRALVSSAPFSHQEKFQQVDATWVSPLLSHFLSFFACFPHPGGTFEIFQHQLESAQTYALANKLKMPHSPKLHYYRL